MSIEGVEGPQVLRHLYNPSAGDETVVAKVNSTAFDEDGLDDGVLGDGQLSSWVVGLRTGEALVEVRVFAGGRASLRQTVPIPEYLLDQQGALFLREDLEDSDAAAKEARSNSSFADGPSTEGGFLYSFSPYERDLSSRPFLIQEGRAPLESLGWSMDANQWAITRFDPTWTDGQPQAAAVAVVDAYTGRVAEVATIFPVHRARVLLADETYDPSVGEVSRVPNLVSFDVPAGTSFLSGALYAQAHTATQRNLVSPHLILRQPNGDIAYEGPGNHGKEGLNLDRTPAGTWTIEVGHDTEAPSTVHLHAFLWAVVSPGA